MLYDFFLHMITPCSPHLRRMGYLDEVIAMRGRYRRNRAAWQPHLEKTRCFVLSAAEECRKKDKAVVLGSGLLLDLPLAELSALFREVILMDVVCLPKARRQIKKYSNVRFIEHDVTTVVERLFLNGQYRLCDLPEPAPIAPETDESTGLVVSLNILSQLWVVPRAYASRHLTGLAEDEVEEWCSRIVRSHYHSLRTLPCDVCLVADHEFVKRDTAGQVISRASTVYDLTLPVPDASWTWNILPMGRDSRFLSKELTVGAWHLHRRVRAEKGEKVESSECVKSIFSRRDAKSAAK